MIGTYVYDLVMRRRLADRVFLLQLRENDVEEWCETVGGISRITLYDSPVALEKLFEPFALRRGKFESFSFFHFRHGGWGVRDVVAAGSDATQII